MTTFALIADPHIGHEKPYEGKIRKLSRHSTAYLHELAGEIDNGFAPHFQVQLGDLIEDSDDTIVDRDNFTQGISLFDRMSRPTLSVIGNHDQVRLSQEQLRELNRTPSLYFSRDLGDLHCVVLFSSSIDHTDIQIEQTQRDWLQQDLSATDRPTIVFLHHPLDEQSLIGNPWFEKYPDYCFVQERHIIRDILERSGKVQAVFNGHVHQNAHSQINGIHYITIQSLVERVAEPEMASRAYGLCTVEENALKLDVRGNDPFKLDLCLKEVN